MNRSSRRRIWVPLLSLSFLTALVGPTSVQPAAAGDVRIGKVVEEGCDGLVLAKSVPADRVDPLVPEQFKLQKTGDQANVFYGAVSCRGVSIEGAEGGRLIPTIWAFLRVEVQDRQGDDPTLSLNDYQLWIASNNKHLVNLFREAGAHDEDAVYVENLTYDHNQATGKIVVDAPDPTPSAFKIVTDPVPPMAPFGSFTVNHWGTGRHGRWGINNDELQDLAIGPVTGELEIYGRNSLMARIFCTTNEKISDPVGHIAAVQKNDYTVATFGDETSPTGKPLPCPAPFASG